MAYIAPSSTVYLFKNVPLEPNYENTVWYPSKEDQAADFLNNYNPIILNSQSYVHKNRGVIKVELPMSRVIDCNYMMFKNLSFEDKWFYAFINRVEYVSNDVTNIFFSIDVIQTWLTEIDFHNCFLERAHTETDACRDWLIPESIDVGPYYIYDQCDFINDATDLCFVIAAPFTIGYDADEGWQLTNWNTVAECGGIPSGTHYSSFLTVTGLNDALIALNGTLPAYYSDGSSAGSKANAISEVVSIFVAPMTLFLSTSQFYNTLWDTYIPVERDDIPASAQAGTYEESYHFRNKKLTVYPYCYYLVTDYSGNDTIYKPELFVHSAANEWVTFQVYGNTAPNGGFIAYPRKYHGFGATLNPSQLGQHSTLDGTKMSGFPTISWSPDTWKSWLASTGIENALNAVTKAWNDMFATEPAGEPFQYPEGVSGGWWDNDGGGLGYAGDNVKSKGVLRTVGDAFMDVSQMSIGQFGDTVGKIVGGASVLYSTIKNLGQYYQQSLKPNTVMGSQNGGARIANNQLNLTLVHYGIGIERGMEIDKFFDAYGYKVNRFGVPYLFANNGFPRPFWNYYKTVGANISGNMPADDNKIICAIFDNGVRFWKGYGAEYSALRNVNNYSLDNAPVYG